ncbi:MAG: hypothetical protein ACRCUY_11920 [Thermoguttaceae bacterium]
MSHLFEKIAFVLLICLILTGCSNEVLIKGSVKYSDGKPLTRGNVVFDSATNSFFGLIDESGNYRTGALRPNQGIPPGAYKVWLSGTETQETIPAKSSKQEGDYKIIPHVAKIYTSPTTTPLVFEVKKDGPKIFDITIERP